MTHTRNTRKDRPGWTIEARIESAIERATRRVHYAQYVGCSERLGAYVYFVKSSNPSLSGASGYNVYVFTNPSRGGYRYEQSSSLWAKCECRAALHGRPCDHGAKAARAASRLVRIKLSPRYLDEGPLICGRCGCENDQDAQVCAICSALPCEAVLEPALEDYEAYELVA